MLANFDLNHLLTFPIKEPEARKQFLIGALVYLVSFVIPILPLLVATGYMMRIMRQVLKGEPPHMIAWDDWTEMFIDGARLFGVRLVVLVPLFLLLCPLIGLSIALPFIMENAGHNADWIALLYPLLFGGFFLLLFPLSLVSGLILPAAEVHVTDKFEFAAAFRVREWWPIFRVNWSGFLLALAIAFAVNFALGLIVQFAMITFVLICLLPFLLPVTAMYLSLVMYTAFAQAYKEGRDRLAVQSLAVPAEGS
jgi:hypothetical protein